MKKKGNNKEFNISVKGGLVKMERRRKKRNCRNLSTGSFDWKSWYIDGSLLLYRH